MLLSWVGHLRCLLRSNFIERLVKGIDCIGLSELTNVVVVLWF